MITKGIFTRTKIILSLFAIFFIGFFGILPSTPVYSQDVVQLPNCPANQTPTARCKVPITGVCPPRTTQGTTSGNAKACEPNATTPQGPEPVQSPDGDGEAGYNFFRILPFDCLFEVENETNVCQEGLLNALADFLVALATPLAILVLIWGGYRYFFGGFQGKLDGMKTIQAALIGLALVYAAEFVTTTVRGVFDSDTGFNIDGLTPLINTIIDTLINFSFVLALLVIVWGGYRYLFGGFAGKADGMESIRAGVIGIVVISLARFIATTTQSLVQNISTLEDFQRLPGQVTSVLTPIVLQTVTVLQGIAGLVAVLVIVWGGYQYFFAALPNAKANGQDTISKGIIGLIVVILSRPIVGIVQATIQPQNTTLNINPTSVIYTIQIIVTNFLIPVSAAIAVFFIVLGGYQLLTSAGDQTKSKNGYTNIRNAAIGLLVVLLATTFTQIIVFVFRNTDLTANRASDPIEQPQPNPQQSGNQNNSQSGTNTPNNNSSSSSDTPPTPNRPVQIPN